MTYRKSSKFAKLPAQEENSNEKSKTAAILYKVFVGGVSQKIKSSSIVEYFESFGALDRKKTSKDLLKYRKRGFVFIFFSSKKAYCDVLSKPIHDIKGNLVEVKPALSPRALRDQEKVAEQIKPIVHSMYNLSQAGLKNQAEELTELYFRYKLYKGKLDK